MNFIMGCAYQFVSAQCDKLLVKVVPDNWPTTAPNEPITTGPAIQYVTKGAKAAPARTYQDMLKNEYDAMKLRYYLTVEILSIDCSSPAAAAVTDSKSSSTMLIPQSQGGRIIKSLESSPCGHYVSAQIITKFSYSVPIGRFGKDVEIWYLQQQQQQQNNKSISTNLTTVVASLPVDDEIPLGYDACTRHPRGFQFHPCRRAGNNNDDATIIYAVATDGGISLTEGRTNANMTKQEEEEEEATLVVVDGEHDAVYCRVIQLDENNNTLTLREPTKLVGLKWRYAGIDFTESGLCIIDEYRWNDRMERKWILDDRLVGGSGYRKLLWERSWEDRYTSPGTPLSRRSVNGQYLIVQPTDTSIYLQGSGASTVGDRPFLDQLDFSSEKTKTTRLWRCTAPVDGELDASKEVNGVLPLPTERKDVYESMICLMKDNDTIFISRESKITPRNYFLTKISNLEVETQITNFQHPQPDLLGIAKELVEYCRDDGVALTANLYLPANYDGTPRPTLFWAYPREFKDAKAAGQVKGSKHRFVSAHWASPIHWAAKGWVIMDDFSLPVIGEGDAQPNDTFIEQLVSGATAAVKYVTDRGVCDPTRCAVGGHSYGSFMTAHLLSHTSLFAAGIGRSGAFNRTLTPMSFQSEERSIWEAPETYITMSPLMHAKKYSLQERVGKLLLIHGAADENDGTHTQQSERYFAALKAFGKLTIILCIILYLYNMY
jgi:dipeptidyl aminopeptidase/acylaminoacyl peptidase